MLERGRDACLGHAAHHGRAVVSGSRGIMTVLALERPDRRVRGVRARRNHVHHRREIEVDAGRGEFPAPGHRVRLKGGDR